jgi:catechol 2,3-dioxygenase-like lactoylglutathione lyase family enzyme
MATKLNGMLLAWAMLMGSAAGLPEAKADEAASFHHVHINSVDPARSIKFYERNFSGVPVKFAGVSDALLVDRSFILYSKVDEPAPTELTSALWHIGWGGVDGPSDHAWREKAGVEFETPATPLGNWYFMYAYGPDRELVEVWTAYHHHRFGHVHLFADDVNVTRDWYRAHLGLQGPANQVPKPPPVPEGFEPQPGDISVFRYLWATQVTTGGVTINIFGKPGPEKPFWWSYDPIDEFAPTRGRVIDHIAFSYRDIEPVFERMQAAGLEIVEPIAERSEYGLRSFFVQGPDGVLIEIVEAKPLPEGVWEE